MDDDLLKEEIIDMHHDDAARMVFEAKILAKHLVCLFHLQQYIFEKKVSPIFFMPKPSFGTVSKLSTADVTRSAIRNLVFQIQLRSKYKSLITD